MLNKYQNEKELAAKIYMLLCVDAMSFHGRRMISVNRDLESIVRLIQEDENIVSRVMDKLIDANIIEIKQTYRISAFKAKRIPNEIKDLNITVDELLECCSKEIESLFE